MHFSTPEGRKITPSDTKKKLKIEIKNREVKEKELREWKKKRTDIPFDFYIVYFGDLKREKNTEENQIRTFYYITLFTPQPGIRL